MQDTNQDHWEPRICYIALKQIKHHLHGTFDVIKDNPMDLNLLMEHVARLTSSVAIMSEYLAEIELDREQRPLNDSEKQKLIDAGWVFVNDEYIEIPDDEDGCMAMGIHNIRRVLAGIK